MSIKANPKNLGKKINGSHVVFQVTKLLYEGIPDMQVARVLQERYSFKVSVPSIASFRNNYYPNRIVEMKKFSQEFQSQQTGRIKSFIDESLVQANAIKNDINELNKQVKFLEKELSFVSKFDSVFQTSLDAYIKNYDPKNPKPFMESDSSPEETKLREIITNMGEGVTVLANYAGSRSPHSLVKLLTFLRGKILDQREALVKIHKDIFKGYRNFSIMQELTMVFEKYNGLIIEEFFPDKKTMDKGKYYGVRKKILALFDELQIRYQGVEAPTDQGRSPSEVDAASFANKAGKEGVENLKKPAVKKPRTGIGGQQPAKTTIIKREREARAKAEAAKAEQPISVEISDEEAATIMGDAQAQAKVRSAPGSMDTLFSDIVDEGQDIVADLDGRVKDEPESKGGQNEQNES